MPFSRCAIQLPKLTITASWQVTAIYLLTCSLIAGCGGGGSTENPDITIPPENTSSNINSGVYFANNSKDKAGNATELTLIVNSDSVSSASGKFYGLQFYSASGSTPLIFAGDISGIGTKTANVNPMTGFSIYPGTATPEQGNFSITSPTSGELKIDGLSASTKLDWGTPKSESNISIDSPASAAALQGAWSGSLYFPGGSNLTFPITFAQDLTFSASFDQCLISGQASASASGKNFFGIRFTLATDLKCNSLSGKTLNGLAFITTPVAGKNRLQWVATSDDGKGLSFKSDLKNQ